MVTFGKCDTHLRHEIRKNLKFFCEYVDNHQWFKRHRLTSILATELKKKQFWKKCQQETFLIEKKSGMPMIIGGQFDIDPESFDP